MQAIYRQVLVSVPAGSFENGGQIVSLCFILGTGGACISEDIQ